MDQPRPLCCLFLFFSNTNFTEITVGFKLKLMWISTTYRIYKYIIIFYILSFKSKFCIDSSRLHQDSNSDRWSRRQEHWPLDHHHSPITTFTLTPDLWILIAFFLFITLIEKYACNCLFICLMTYIMWPPFSSLHPVTLYILLADLFSLWPPTW